MRCYKRGTWRRPESDCTGPPQMQRWDVSRRENTVSASETEETLRQRVDMLEDLLHLIWMEHFISDEIEERIETVLGIETQRR